MNRADAFKRLRRILGADFAYRENPRALVGEAREDARVEWRAAVEAAAVARAARDARRAELLADPEFVRLEAACKAAHEHADTAGSLFRSRRLTVGKTNGLFFSVKAEGDNWQEVVDELTKPKP